MTLKQIYKDNMIGTVWTVIGNALLINPIIHNVLIPIRPRGRAYQLAKKDAIAEVERALNSFLYENGLYENVNDSELEE